jgi:serine/threonine-protein kinase
MNIKKAKAKAYDIGLRVNNSSSEFSSKPKGMILSQEPDSGRVVKRGHHIFVVTSKGSEIGVVPKVSGKLSGPAKSALRKEGFSRIVVKNIYSPYIEQNKVISTEPHGGSKTSRDGNIVLYISKGKRPTSTFVPNLVGEMVSNARTLIENANLEVGKISYEKSHVVGPGRVIKQSVPANSKVKFESRVNIVVSKE